MYLAGSVFRAGHIGPEDDWHSHRMIYHEAEVVSVDPEYTGNVDSLGQRRVQNMGGLGLVVEFLPYMYKKQRQSVHVAAGWARQVDRVRTWTRGFGVPGQQRCNMMSGRWVESFAQAVCAMEWFDP